MVNIPQSSSHLHIFQQILDMASLGASHSEYVYVV